MRCFPGNRCGRAGSAPIRGSVLENQVLAQEPQKEVAQETDPLIRRPARPRGSQFVWVEDARTLGDLWLA